MSASWAWNLFTLVIAGAGTAGGERFEPADPMIVLRTQRIFFGHQSVGQDVLEGLSRLSPELRVVEVRGGSPAPEGPGLFHVKVGQNEQPLTKMEDFERQLASAVTSAGGVDVALYKLCYVDINATTDVDLLFSAYRRTHERLRRAHPEVQLVHVTVPLTVVQRGLRAWVKERLGRPPYGVAENIQRHRYNEQLRKTYGGKEPLFDLAMLESTRADGSVERAAWRGASSPALVPGYASDGAHLNAAGAERVARGLVAVLGALRPREAAP